MALLVSPEGIVDLRCLSIGAQGIVRSKLGNTNVRIFHEANALECIIKNFYKLSNL